MIILSLFVDNDAHYDLIETKRGSNEVDNSGVMMNKPSLHIIIHNYIEKQYFL